jgi:hypothetical protein
VTSSVTLPFDSYPTLDALAATINALGNGWSAVVQASGAAPAVGLWPSAALVGVREPKNALSSGASLDAFLTAASSCDIDRSTGIMRCYGWGGNGSGGWDPWGDPSGASWDGAGGRGGAWGWGQFRVRYQAGWVNIPESLQLVAAEAVKGIYARLDGDPSLKSETADKYSWAAKDSLGSLPDWATSTLMYYKSWAV